MLGFYAYLPTKNPRNHIWEKWTLTIAMIVKWIILCIFTNQESKKPYMGKVDTK